MNNRPLTYIGEEFEKPAITPNTLIRGERVTLLEESGTRLKDSSTSRNVRNNYVNAG